MTTPPTSRTRTFARLEIDYQTTPSLRHTGHYVPRELLQTGDVLETLDHVQSVAILATPAGAEVTFGGREITIATEAENEHFAWVCLWSQMREIIDLAKVDDEGAQLRIAHQIFADRGAERNLGDMTVREICAAIRTAQTPCIVV